MKRSEFFVPKHYSGILFFALILGVIVTLIYGNLNDNLKNEVTTLTGIRIPTYDEYKLLAAKNNWNPIDPIEKLKSTCILHGQVTFL
jgi:hypothetical protein